MAGLDLSVDAGEFFGINPSMLDGDGLAAVQDVLWEIIYSWREVLQDAWPRDTGLSFQSWTSRVRGLTLEIVNPVEYAEYVHAAGETVGAAADAMKEALDHLLAGATAAIAAIVQEATTRRSSGVAQPAQQIAGPAPAQFDGGFRAAMERAFTTVGGRARQTRFFEGLPLGQAEPRKVLRTQNAVVARFRDRVRVRERTR